MRTAVCDGCAANGLERRHFNPATRQWEVVNGDLPKGWSREFRLYDRASGERHSCDAVPGEVSGMVTESDVRKIAGEMAREIAGQECKLAQASGTAATLDAATVRPVVDSVLGDMIPEAVAATVTTSRAKIAEIARKAIEDMVPVRHEITVRDGDTLRVVGSGTPHRLVQTLVDLATLRLNIMMVGPAGSGKTTAARMAADALGVGYFERSMGPQTSQWDLLGYLSPDGAYVPGILRKAYEFGGVLMLDEIDNANPSVLTVLNSAVANGHCTFPDREVERHADFILIASGNTYGRGADRLYVGRMPLDGATLDRFAVLDWDYDESAEIEWAGGEDATEWVRYVQAIRHTAATLKMRVIVSPRSSIMGATMLRSGRFTRAQVEEIALWRGISADDRRKLTGAVARTEAA